MEEKDDMRLHARLLGSASTVVLALLLVGCGSTSATIGLANGATRTPGANTTPTVTPTLLPTYTPAPPDLSTFESKGACTPQLAGDQVINLGGGLQALKPGPLLQYPHELLPSSLGNTPYQLPSSISTAASNPNPYVNPALLWGVTVCNPTTQPHTLAALGMRIESFQPSSGPVNEWGICDGFFDSSTRQPGGGGCGGAYGGADVLQAVFTSDTAGATAQATVSTGYAGTSVAPPVVIQPGMSAFFSLSPTGLTTDGTYRLSFQFTAQGAAPVTITPLSPPILIAQHARDWTGQNCQSMANQVPTTAQPEQYVCP